MRRALVSSFLADVTQQIHSLRASGVMSAHTSFAIESDSIALRKSAGILCNVPVSTCCFAIHSCREASCQRSPKLERSAIGFPAKHKSCSRELLNLAVAGCHVAGSKIKYRFLAFVELAQDA